jgi:hypothetical protein
MEVLIMFDNLDQTMGETYTPFAAKTDKGDWMPGTLSVDFLNANFGKYSTAAEMKAATESEGLKLFFDWLVKEGKLS